MAESVGKSVKVALLDLYAGVANQGMRCIREILNQFSDHHQVSMDVEEFEVRIAEEVPDMSHDVYISSGGPGSPLETKGSDWERKYFNWLGQIEEFNADVRNKKKKQVFFICHSFQLICRHYEVADVTARNKTAFGVFPIHSLSTAETEPVFQGLKDPFYVVDSRDFQVVQPNQPTLKKMGARILAIEKARPHVAYERAVMAIRFNEHMIGTQFHPEADAIGMSRYLQTDEKKKTVIESHGVEKWESMIEHLNDPDKIMSTYAHILPNFLSAAIKA